MRAKMPKNVKAFMAPAILAIVLGTTAARSRTLAERGKSGKISGSKYTMLDMVEGKVDDAIKSGKQGLGGSKTYEAPFALAMA